MYSVFLPTAILAVPTLLTVHTYSHADWPHDMQQLNIVLLMCWTSDADSQGYIDLQSLVQVACIVESLIRQALMHHCIRPCDAMRCIELSAKLVQCSSGLTILGHTCFSVCFVVGIC
ncbi:TPA: hypothetical protein ACH3X2_004209 [Trebouxia sp. C0005]